MTPPFPFAAVVGMADLRLALLLCAVSPAIGGVLVRGEKGTAKSTTVRALTALLPPVPVVVGCRFNCDPDAPDESCPDGPQGSCAQAGSTSRPARLVELPVGAAEDRVLGSLDLERALGEGVTAFEPGLLAAAHRGLLYVDEVNLLHDHLVDVLLDAAAMGRVTVEREQVSVSHAARFVLVGTMNPEEGELRPQLLDRFGLAVEVRASREPDTRVEVVRRGLDYEADPAEFVARFAEQDESLRHRVVAARELLPHVELSDAALRQVAHVCAAFDVDGMRADLVTARTAIAHAAWQGRRAVTAEDVREAARLALPHRRRRNPFDAPGVDDEALDRALEEAAAAAPAPESTPGGGEPSSPDGDATAGGPGRGDDPEGGVDGTPNDGPDGSGSDPDGGPGGSGGGAAPPQPPASPADAFGESTSNGSTAAGGAHRGDRQPAGDQQDKESVGAAGREDTTRPGAPYRARTLRAGGVGRRGVPGRRSRAITSEGRLVRTRRPRRAGADESARPELPATLLAAAVHQRARGRRGPGRLVVRPSDVRVADREGREANLVLFCVDASGSMAARRRMAAVAAAVVSLLLDAYRRRDTVAVVSFRGGGAEVALPPTSSVEAAVRRLDGLRTGGRTPLAEGLATAQQVMATARVRDPGRRPLLVVVTDGRATAGHQAVPRALAAAERLAATGTASVVVDCEPTGPGAVRLGLARDLAGALGAEHLPLGDVAVETLTGAIRATTASHRGRAA